MAAQIALGGCPPRGGAPSTRLSHSPSGALSCLLGGGRRRGAATRARAPSRPAYS
jgi:hypothetical protein